MSSQKNGVPAAPQPQNQKQPEGAAIVTPGADGDLDTRRGSVGIMLFRSPAEINFHRGLVPQLIKGSRQIRRDIARKLKKEQKGVAA